ncbi:hypothetical protein CDAR_532831 [Caerostris darwini]|uniref:Uncharacterized protein n=1 Tax=Caerostris darwini TaxID=1538125 RepID=A0AAV4W1V3_9ARAC|nr:hypothetical protein CDAR_532831 [Caerostris darwini]
MTQIKDRMKCGVINYPDKDTLTRYPSLRSDPLQPLQLMVAVDESSPVGNLVQNISDFNLDHLDNGAFSGVCSTQPK